MRPLNSKEACQYLSVSLSTLNKYCHFRKIPYSSPLGRKRYFLQEDLDAFLLGNRVSTMAEIQAKAANQVVKEGVL